MKRGTLIFSLLIVLISKLFSQDTTAINPNKIYPVFSTYYLYNKKVIKEKEVLSMLNNTGNQQIMNLVEQSKNNKQLMNIKYLFIPAGIGAVAFTRASFTNIYYRNGTTNQNKKNLYEVATVFCLAATIASPVISYKFQLKRRKYTNEAVKLYNEKY